MITLYIFDNFTEARASKFGSSIRHWPAIPAIKKVGGEIHEVIIGEAVVGRKKKEYFATVANVKKCTEAEINLQVLEVLTNIREVLQ